MQNSDCSACIHVHLYILFITHTWLVAGTKQLFWNHSGEGWPALLWLCPLTEGGIFRVFHSDPSQQFSGSGLWEDKICYLRCEQHQIFHFSEYTTLKYLCIWILRNIVDSRVELVCWSDCSYAYFICYIFQVIARELRTNPKRSSSVKMTVNILDVNDNQPQFGNSSYSARIAENAPTGTTFTRLQVRPSSDSIYLSWVLLTFEIYANVLIDLHPKVLLKNLS